jgi:hypothetical protein
MKNIAKATLLIIAATAAAMIAFMHPRPGESRISHATSNSTSSALLAASSSYGASFTPVVANATNIKFASSPYAKISYLVSGNTLSPQAQRILAGYQFGKTQLADGGTQITLHSTSTFAKPQVYTLTPGEKFYLVDSVSGDDSLERDYNPGDDKAIIVNQNGYVVTLG